MKIDAIILTKSSDLSHYGLTCRTINTLKNSTDSVDIIVVESEREESFKEKGFIYHGCNTVFPKQNFSYNKFLNIGVQQTKSDWILICNNDLVFSKNWLIEMEKVISKNPEIKSFSPSCPHWHLHQNMQGEIEEGYTVSKNICGWCILLHKSVVEECDLFDEQFDFWYQDNDYSMSLQSKGVRHALVINSKVYHMVSGSHDLLREREYQMTHGQQEIFNKKWMK
jgi:GT2 family glycosyltransferase